jgi:hypothetical protein
MTSGITPLYAATRSALLDALDALRGQHRALILVGAQAIFLHTGEVDEAIATETKDADLAVNPNELSDDPRIEQAMTAARFHLDATHPQPGSWINAAGYPVDLLPPEAVAGRAGRGRSGRIPPHDKMATRRVRGIEGALVDHAPMIVAGLEGGDARQHEVLVAGPSALLVAKLHKIAERVEQPRRQRPRDSHDVFRLLREVEVEVFAAGFAAMKTADVSREVALEAIGHLRALFSDPSSHGSQQAALAVAGCWRTHRKSRCAAQCWPPRSYKRSSEKINTSRETGTKRVPKQADLTSRNLTQLQEMPANRQVANAPESTHNAKVAGSNPAAAIRRATLVERSNSSNGYLAEIAS